LPDGYLPRADARGDATTAPEMALMGRLRLDPASAIVAGDVRANENTGLTAIHTLFAREHNRIVDLLPSSLDEETKFQIARKIVIAEQQYITYNEYLTSIGIELDAYQSYDPNVDPSITNEFATVGYRAHSMVHGDFDFDRSNLSDADLAILESQGALRDGGQIEVPVNTQSGNPSVVNKVGLGAVIEGLFETNYNNDEQIDNQLRSILFQIPQFGNSGGEFTDGPPIEQLFNGVLDIGSLDIQRGRDHGILSYNDLREAFGLERVDSFYDITGEDPDAIKAFVDSEDLRDVDGIRITSADLIFDAQDIDLNDPHIIDFIAILDENGELEADPQEIADLLARNEEVEGVDSIRRSTVAARLEAIYGDIDKVDAFVGMISEEHLPGTEFGELQQAIWRDQFEALRDGDRFFYLNDPDLAEIQARFGISYQHSLADIIAHNTDLNREDILDNVFVTESHLAV
ncbi:MAG: peroxidase family protein, partial [Waterburya sp.]